jgi:NADPH:quinone reductase-like Zn-dependent oxidoreductase
LSPVGDVASAVENALAAYSGTTVAPHEYFDQTVVVQAGGGAAVNKGQRVAFRFSGAWAEYCRVPSSRLIEVPSGMTDEVACQMSLNPVTAWALLQESRALSGDWILVTAATSTVSNIVGAIARRLGIKVTGLVRGDAAATKPRCTADYVLPADVPTLTADIAEIAGRNGIQALLDSVGGPLIARLFETPASGARIIAYGVQDRSAAAVTNAMLIYSNFTWQGFSIDRWPEQSGQMESRAMLDELWSMVRDGTLRLPIASVHTLDEFADALRADARQGRNGRVILVSR